MCFMKNQHYNNFLIFFTDFVGATDNLSANKKGKIFDNNCYKRLSLTNTLYLCLTFHRLCTCKQYEPITHMQECVQAAQGMCVCDVFALQYRYEEKITCQKRRRKRR